MGTGGAWGTVGRKLRYWTRVGRGRWKEWYFRNYQFSSASGKIQTLSRPATASMRMFIINIIIIKLIIVLLGMDCGTFTNRLMYC